MPDLIKMRNDLYSKYPGKAWKRNVDTMPDNQVVAVWYSFLKRDQQKKLPKESTQPKEQQAVQLRLF